MTRRQLVTLPLAMGTALAYSPVKHFGEPVTLLLQELPVQPDRVTVRWWRWPSTKYWDIVTNWMVDDREARLWLNDRPFGPTMVSIERAKGRKIWFDRFILTRRSRLTVEWYGSWHNK